MAGKCTLRRNAAADRFLGRLDHHEEAVPLGSHLMSAVSREGGAQNSALSRQRLAVLVAKTAQQPSRTLDVAKEHRDGPRGEHPHPSIITACPERRRAAANAIDPLVCRRSGGPGTARTRPRGRPSTLKAPGPRHAVECGISRLKR